MTFSPNFESSLSSPVTDDFVSLSRRFYADEGLRADLASPSRQASAEPTELILDDPFASLPLTSTEGNAKFQSRDGNAQLVKVGEGDPLADGKLDIELETGDRSVKEAILAADQAVKQYYRELIAAFQASHPGQDYPSWWNDILQSQPEADQNQNQNVSQERPQSQSQAQFQPQTQTQNPFMDRLNSLMGPYNPDYSGIYPGSDIPRGATSFIPQDQPVQPGQIPDPAYSFPDLDTQTSGISSNVDSQTLLNNVRTVVDVAERHGVDPNLAVAMMLVESGGDNRAVGDGGTSFGLFQLHRGGMLTEAGLSRDQAFDPRVNAEVSIGHLAEIDQNYADPGRAAAASQRPAHRQEYARRVNANMDDAARLVAMASQSGGNQGIA